MSVQLARAFSPKPEARLEQAIKQFEADLSNEQRASFRSDQFQSSQSPPNIRDVMRITAEIDRRVSGKVGDGRCLGTRVVNILEAVQRFAALGDVVVGGSQNLIACGVWSLVRMTLLTFVNISSWFDKLSELFMMVGRSAPRYEAMAALYPQSKKLQPLLSEYYLVLVRMCHNILKSTQKTRFSQFFCFLTESDIKSYRSDFDIWSNAIKEEMDHLMAMQISEQGNRLKTLLQSSQSESHRRGLKNRLRILNACSTYDFQKVWKEIRRCGNTSWFSLQQEYQDFKKGDESCTLIFSGKLGSGKSIALANMVDDLNLSQESKQPVAYFFCRHDDTESLHARTIIGSLARQLLSTIENLGNASDDLTTADSPAQDSQWIVQLLKRHISSMKKAYIVLDGLNERDESQKEDVILQLQEIQTICPVLICLSFRQEAGDASALQSGQLANPSILAIPEDNPDIPEYIQAEMERLVESGRLRVGDPTLVLEIRDSMVEGAQGMFLWVVLQLASLCMAQTDEEIRQALADLPKDLPSTFSRILEQSAPLGQQYQQRILELITGVYRPLTTNELREALGVVPGDANWDPARMPNDIFAALAACGSLVTVDEETGSAKLIHPSVKQYLHRRPEMNNGNKTILAIIATYSNYGIFDTQLSTSTTFKHQNREIPEKIIGSVLDSQSVRKFALSLLRSREPRKINLSEALARMTGPSTAQTEANFFFLVYARSHWEQHAFQTQDLDPVTYRDLGRALDRRILIVDNSRDTHNRTILSRASENRHQALVQLLLDNGAAVDSRDTGRRTPLSWACAGGHKSIAELLLDKGAAVNSIDEYDWTPLMSAARGGHADVVQLLLNNGAAVNPTREGPWTPLMSAARGGHADVVQLLLNNGAAVNPTREGPWAPLEVAAEGGHVDVVQLLLDNGATVNPQDGILAPLRAAAEGGHADVVQLLLNNGAAVNPTREGPWAPLRLAAERGHVDVVQLLLDNGATVNPQDGILAPLRAAAEGGHADVVQLLLDIGAVIDVRDRYDGWTPLARAAKEGHKATVQVLLSKGASVTSQDRDGHTPLEWASKNGHKSTEQLLLAFDKGAIKG